MPTIKAGAAAVAFLKNENEDEAPFIRAAMEKHALFVKRYGIIYAASQLREVFTDDGVQKTRLVEWHVWELGMDDVVHVVDPSYNRCSCGHPACQHRLALKFGSS